MGISGLEARYALGGAGRSAYDPRILLALLILALLGPPPLACTRDKTGRRVSILVAHQQGGLPHG